MKLSSIKRLRHAIRAAEARNALWIRSRESFADLLSYSVPYRGDNVFGEILYQFNQVLEWGLQSIVIFGGAALQDLRLVSLSNRPIENLITIGDRDEAFLDPALRVWVGFPQLARHALGREARIDVRYEFSLEMEHRMKSAGWHDIK